MEKLKTLCETATQKVRNAKFAVGALTASAALPVITVVASADDTASPSTTTSLAQYSSDIQNTFTGMVNDIMPIAIGVLGAGAAIFGLFIAWKLARKALKSVTG